MADFPKINWYLFDVFLQSAALWWGHDPENKCRLFTLKSPNKPPTPPTQKYRIKLFHMLNETFEKIATILSQNHFFKFSFKAQFCSLASFDFTRVPFIKNCTLLFINHIQVNIFQLLTCKSWKIISEYWEKTQTADTKKSNGV